MKELFNSRGADFKPDVVTGISIGAVNAAILAGAEQPLDVLDSVWRVGFSKLAPLPASWEAAYDLIPWKIQQILSLFGNKSMNRLRREYVFNPVSAPYITNSVYETTPLRDTLEKIVDPTLNSYCQVVVSAINVETGPLAKFGNATSKRESGKY